MTTALDGGEWSAARPGKDPVPIVQEAGWAPGRVVVVVVAAAKSIIIIEILVVVYIQRITYQGFG